MLSDIVDLRDFYQTPLGQAAQRLLCARLDEMWPQMRQERVLVLGYGVPLLRSLIAKSADVLAAMPAAQGVAYWPREGPNLSTLVDADQLPLPDASIDRVIALHLLEGLTEQEPVLREIWRVLRSGGRFLAIVPHRRGLWAHSDETPFGHGQPFSSSQIKRLLHSQGFLVERGRQALYALPSTARLALRSADRVERYGSMLFPGLGGLLLTEASKQLYAPRVKPSLRHRLILPLPMQVAGSASIG